MLDTDGGIFQNNYFSTDLYGILVQGEWTIYNCEFENCAYGIWLQLNDPLAIGNCTFSGSGEAFHFWDLYGFPEIQIHYCNFYLPIDGIRVDGDPTTDFIDATWNYWGHASGPTHPSNPGGEGVPVDDGVIFEPWLTAPVPPPTNVQDDFPASGITLHQNSPNPFNPLTLIAFDLDRAREVKLVVFTLTGRKIATLLDTSLGPGHHQALWNGRGDSGQEVASGIYLYRLEAGDYFTSKRMLLVR
jgi:hypothetical protein